MNIDRKLLNIISFLSFAVLLLVFIIPTGNARIITAIILAPFAAISFFFVKKRSIISLNRNQVIMLMSVISLLYLMIYYLTGLYYRFYKTVYRLDFDTLLQYVLPITVIIVASEIIRGVMRAQNSRLADIFTYLACVFADVIASSSIVSFENLNRFMDVVGLSLFPAITANLLYHYLAKRYGIIPNLVYRLLTTLYIYVIPYKSAVPDSLLAFVDLFIPLVIYIFIDSLYERKMRYALGKKNRFSTILSVVAVIFMTLTVMLISNQFRFGAYVIATDSMTGELNRGDAAIYERYDGSAIEVGQVIVFDKNGSKVLHRVVDIKNEDGTLKYYTKGDLNEENDTGFITKSNVVGIVKLKVPYVGYPTIWLHNAFK